VPGIVVGESVEDLGNFEDVAVPAYMHLEIIQIQAGNWGAIDGYTTLCAHANNSSYDASQYI
jgi:hypothetical protein